MRKRKYSYSMADKPTDQVNYTLYGHSFFTESFFLRWELRISGPSRLTNISNYRVASLMINFDLKNLSLCRKQTINPDNN